MRKFLVLLLLLLTSIGYAADQKVTELDTISPVAAGDLLYIVDITTNTAKKVTMDALIDAWLGSGNIATVGTIGSGTWQGTAIAAGYIAGDAIDETKIADDGIDSEHHNDGSIDLVHLAAGVYAKDIVTTSPVTGATDNVLVGADADITLALDFTAAWDFGGASSFELPQSAAPTTDAAGEIALDTTITDHQPFFQYYDGDENMTLVALPTANLNSTDNYIMKYDAGSDDWQMEADATGAGGSAITYDLGDDGGDDSTDLTELAIVNDTDGVWDEPSADKARFDGASLLYESELNTFSKLDTLVADADLASSGSTNTFTEKTFSADGSGMVITDIDEGNCKSSSNLLRSAIEFIIDGGGSAISAGGGTPAGFIEIPFDCTIKRATLLADQSGSIIIDFWVDSYANFPPDNDDSITDVGTSLTISGAVKEQDSTMTDWELDLTAGDILAIHVDSAATVEQITISLLVEK